MPKVKYQIQGLPRARKAISDLIKAMKPTGKKTPVYAGGRSLARFALERVKKAAPRTGRIRNM